MIGDLHCHSTASDGSMKIGDLIQYAGKVGLDYIALTDHDTMSGVSQAIDLGRKYGVRVISGIEISTIDPKRGRKAHLLCYLPVRPELLAPMLEETIKNRDAAMQKSLQMLKAFFPVSEQQVLENAADAPCIYKAHVMQALLDMGYADAVYGEVFREMLGPNGKCYVKNHYPDVRKAAHLVQDAGGVCVLAHPSVYDSAELMQELAEEELLDGIERNHPRNREPDIILADRLCREYGLIATGGTDFHGAYTGNPNPLGTYLTSHEQLDRLFACAKSKQ